MAVGWYLLLLVVCLAICADGQEASFSWLKHLLHRNRRQGFPRGPACTNKTISLNAGSQEVNMGYDLHGRSYDNNANCQWQVTADAGTNIVLVSRAFLVEYSFDCRYDYLEIFDGTVSSDASLGKFCGRQEIRLISSTNKLYIRFRSDSTVTGPGFRFQLRKTQTDASDACNKTLAANTGVIKSPNFPKRYKNDVTCVYKIQTRSPNKVIKLSFEKFSLERKPCRFDYLAVYNGASSASKKVGSYCGRNFPESITSTGSSMLLFFRSDSFVRAKGFKLKYTVVDQRRTNNVTVVEGKMPDEYDPDCSNIISELGRNLTSPRSEDEDDTAEERGYYLRRKKCRTDIRAPADHVVAVRFSFFDLEDSLDCLYDHVNVTYKPAKGALKTVRLCGYHRRNSLCFMSSDNNLKIDFESDRIFEGFGYTATYRFVRVNETRGVYCPTPHCNATCGTGGSCYNNGGGFHCACSGGKVPPHCYDEVRFLTTNQNVTMFADSQVKLNCKVNHPHTITVWDFNHTMLPDDTRRNVKITADDQLELDNVQTSNSGVYACSVQAGSQLLTREIWLTVKEEIEHCGLAPDVPDPNSNAFKGLVAGKNATKARNIPWQVLMWKKSTESHHCGGVLISSRYVLSAAHCVKGPKVRRFDVSDYRIIVGTTKCKSSDQGESRSILRYLIHPGYNQKTLQHDVVILELDRPITNLSKEVYPICLPSSKATAKVRPGLKGLISGCGKAEGGDLPDQLHYVDVPIVNRTICSASRNNKDTFTEDQFCAGYVEGEVGDACDGDSGGAFAMNVEGRWTLLGLVSYGEGCAKPGEYGFYSDISISPVLKWIKGNAGWCGKRRIGNSNSDDGKILNGIEARPGRFPWNAALIFFQGDTKRLSCSASIISDGWFITAAHCFGRKKSAVSTRLVPGVLSWRDTNEAEFKEYRIRKGFYKTKEDIALVEVEGLNFSDYVQPICLPHDDEVMPAGASGLIAGWGETNTESSSDNLLWASLKKLSATDCDNTWKTRYVPSTNKKLCARGVNGTEAARGDSGTGLAWRHQDSFVLSGIHNGGRARENLTGLFHETEDLLPWIRDILGWRPRPKIARAKLLKVALN